uniref:Uncharacterized protein n=1 Tax=Panagrolaimus davidi TaxID=227884 RepID=A0A914QA98_9BILA
MLAVEKLILKYEGIAMNGLPQNCSSGEESKQQPEGGPTTEKENENLKVSKEKVEYWLSYKFILPNNNHNSMSFDSESLSSPASLFYVPNNPFDPSNASAGTIAPKFSQDSSQHDQMQQQQQNGMEQMQYYNSCDNSTQQLLDSEALGNETEEKLVLCNTNDNQLTELLQILKENERQNAEINALRLERERIELEEAKIRLTLAEEEISRMNNNDNLNCSLQLLDSL